MQSIQHRNSNINFGAAKDINLRYILEKRAHLLPERILTNVQNIVERTQGMSIECLPTLKEVHNDTFRPLMSAESLEQAKLIFPEFGDVLDFSLFTKKFSRSARVIEKTTPPESFSLDCLKKIWSGMPQEEIVRQYGFSCRDVVAKLCKALNIPKPLNNYLVLLKSSDEVGNQMIAAETRRHLDVCIKNLKLANIANKTPEARVKQAESMRNFYVNHPQRRERIAEISRLTWEKCPEIRAAKAEYFDSLTPYQKSIMSKQSYGIALTAEEKRIVSSVHKKFWEAHPEFREIYAAARTAAVREIKES